MNSPDPLETRNSALSLAFSSLAPVCSVDMDSIAAASTRLPRSLDIECRSLFCSCTERDSWLMRRSNFSSSASICPTDSYPPMDLTASRILRSIDSISCSLSCAGLHVAS